MGCEPASVPPSLLSKAPLEAALPRLQSRRACSPSPTICLAAAAAAPSKTLACSLCAVYRQIFHFSFIMPACTVT